MGNIVDESMGGTLNIAVALHSVQILPASSAGFWTFQGIHETNGR